MSVPSTIIHPIESEFLSFKVFISTSTSLVFILSSVGDISCISDLVSSISIGFTSSCISFICFSPLEVNIFHFIIYIHI